MVEATAATRMSAMKTIIAPTPMEPDEPSAVCTIHRLQDALESFLLVGVLNSGWTSHQNRKSHSQVIRKNPTIAYTSHLPHCSRSVMTRPGVARLERLVRNGVRNMRDRS